MRRTVAGTAGYSANAIALAQQYEHILFEDVHRDVLHLFPHTPSGILDIGAGSGRDAAALARLGHRIVALEPTLELRQEGQRIHAALPIEWVDDALPCLSAMRARREQFDLILLTAVWMHLDAAERAIAMRAIAELLAPGASVIMSLRHGPVPHGRRMFDVSADETLELGRAIGLAERYIGQRKDTQGRDSVSWSVIALQMG
ncbi:class I SAM-dependent methyltransferase [Cupriavidus sp. YAF13]|uniref:class I SAM-dependent methyltransferase n=1 Tax=Cupriavidus sp. YAF13 TaxID=3233075 RepID=UPI003F9231D4